MTTLWDAFEDAAKKIPFEVIPLPETPVRYESIIITQDITDTSWVFAALYNRNRRGGRLMVVPKEACEAIYEYGVPGTYEYHFDENSECVKVIGPVTPRFNRHTVWESNESN